MNSPPEGIEKKIAELCDKEYKKWLNDFAKDIQGNDLTAGLELFYKFDTADNIDDWVKGSRWNGDNSLLCTLPGVIEFLQNINKECSYILKKVLTGQKKLKKLMDKIIVKSLKTCPTCHGHGGKRKDNPCFKKGERHWNDCSRCNGRGIVLKELNHGHSTDRRNRRAL